MKKLLVFVFIIVGYSFQMKSNYLKWVVIPGGSLKVVGSTNVNNFSCDIINYAKPDTILVARGAPIIHLNGKIALDVQKFDCHNPVMTADLRKTLKSKQFPHLVISFISINRYPEPGSRDKLTKGLVLIDLAGVTKKFEVDYRIVAATAQTIHLEGTRKVHFSDFNIAPPRKLGGMIRTNDELQVVFNLKQKVLE